MNREEREQIFREIQEKKSRIQAKYDRINQIKGEIDQNKSRLPGLYDARRSHTIEARKPHMRDCGYQGGYVDEQIGNIRQKK